MIEFVNGRNVNGVMCCGDFATALLLQLQVFQLSFQLQVSAASARPALERRGSRLVARPRPDH
jgi:hypothetical protein